MYSIQKAWADFIHFVNLYFKPVENMQCITYLACSFFHLSHTHTHMIIYMNHCQGFPFGQGFLLFSVINPPPHPEEKAVNKPSNDQESASNHIQQPQPWKNRWSLPDNYPTHPTLELYKKSRIIRRNKKWGERFPLHQLSWGSPSSQSFGVCLFSDKW